jgi:hypothetical protein
VRHRAVQRGFADRLRIRPTEKWRDQLAIDPFLEYVRADRQPDDDEREDTPVG